MVIAKVYKTKLGRPDDAQLIRDFFENDYIKIRTVDRHIADKAVAISQQFGLKSSDAIHIATAIEAKCEIMHTYDGEDGKRKRPLAFDGQIGKPPLEIKISEISWKPKQKGLFDDIA